MTMIALLQILPRHFRTTALAACLLGWVVLIAANPVNAGQFERVFKDGFEDTAAMINCPGAMAMDLMTNAQGGNFYRASNAIDPAGDVDFFAVPASAGDWLLVGTDANPNVDPAGIDTVITLYSGDGRTRLAFSDDTTPRLGVDSELYYRTLDDGPLCLQVEDRSTAAGEPPEGGPLFEYAVFSVPLDFNLYDFVNLDAEDNNTVAMAQTGLTYNSSGNNEQNRSTGIAGVFDDVSDQDVYELRTPAQALRLSVSFTPDGVGGYGGTTPLGIIELIDADGTTVIGRLDYGNGSSALSLPAVGSVSYFLRVGSPPGTLGDNPFYFLKYATLDAANPQEQNEPGNNQFLGAEVANPLMGPAQNSHFIGGNLSASFDTDWWSFQASAGDSVAVFCASRRNGSGVVDMAVAVYQDPNGSPLESDTETATQDLAWFAGTPASRPLVPVTNSGTHYIALSASSFSPDVTDRHYQCGVFVFFGS